MARCWWEQVSVTLGRKFRRVDQRREAGGFFELVCDSVIGVGDGRLQRFCECGNGDGRRPVCWINSRGQEGCVGKCRGRVRCGVLRVGQKREVDVPYARMSSSCAFLMDRKVMSASAVEEYSRAACAMLAAAEDCIASNTPGSEY